MIQHKIVEKKIRDLNPASYNPRTITDAAMKGLTASLDKFGLVQPVVFNKRTGNVVGGHQRIAVLMSKGEDTVQCVEVDLDEAEEQALNITLNNPNITGEFTGELQVMLDQLKTSMPEGTMDELALTNLLHAVMPTETETEKENHVPTVPVNPVSKGGQLWRLGNHRLLCADSRDLELVQKALDGDKVQMVVTSPPYASQRKYDETSGFKPIAPDDYVEWWSDVQNTLKKVIADDGSFFLNIKEHCEEGERHLYVKDLVIAHVREWGWRWVEEYAWTHGGTPKGVITRFKNAWEPVFQFTPYEKFKFRPEAVRHESSDVPKVGPPAGDISKFQGSGQSALGYKQDHVGEGMAYPSNVLSLGKNTEALGHGAAYPVSLPEFFIKAYSDKDDVVMDPFMGSGSTLIACEKTERRAFGTEISPAYCDVIIKRWEDFTGKKAELA